jgi:hypothetical protein
MLDQQMHEMRLRFAKDHQQALWREASDERLARAARPERGDVTSRLVDGWHVLAHASLSAVRHLSLPHDHAPRRRFAHSLSH